jgi:hypothetical protein
LEQLILGVARELQLVEKTKVFQNRERQEYFDALRRAALLPGDTRPNTDRSTKAIQNPKQAPP